MHSAIIRKTILYFSWNVCAKHFYWIFSIAAKLDFPPALNKLGDFHNSGTGIAKDQKIAFEYYRKAAEYQDKDGLVNLG